MVDLNLVPFIDYMSCLIAFLMIAAVWTQVASLDVEQAICDGGDPWRISDDPPVAPLTVRLSAGGFWVGRKVEEGEKVPRSGDGWDMDALSARLQADKALYPREDMVIINTDDGVPYEAMMGVLDLSRQHGYPRTLLAGGPAVVLPPG
jgi:biopolymer transport protein ExbD